MSYNFCVSDFEGPLDLLLHLVKESKMDIYEINIHDIINQYLDFIHSLEEKNIDIASEYLVMASELIHLKSKLLINRQDEEVSEEDEFSITSEEDLRNKLLEYEKYKKLTENFHELEQKRGEVYTKLPESLKEYIEETGIQKGEFNIQDLLDAYRLFIERQKLSKPLNTKITKKELSVDDKIKDIRHLLKNRRRLNFIELFTEITKENVVVTFLSILEMSKNKEILLSQEDNFSPIMIERCE
ncbi:MAG TPA: segregation/condensation protein A [Candidatus Coprovivens excrementavium]|nr:segregation/condensation protein A [Candidatus Coprovivens excrementavium]